MVTCLRMWVMGLILFLLNFDEAITVDYTSRLYQQPSSSSSYFRTLVSINDSNPSSIDGVGISSTIITNNPDPHAVGKLQFRLGLLPLTNSSTTSAPPLKDALSPSLATLLQQQTEQYLSWVRLKLDSNTSMFKPIQCWGDDYTGSRDDFLNDRHKVVLGTEATAIAAAAAAATNAAGSASISLSSSVLVYPMCFRLFQLGNTLGYYFNDLACADASGAHFLGVSRSFSLIQPEVLATPVARHLTFFEALPYQLVHARPLPPAEAKKKMRAECRCLQYCWENTQAPWIPRTALIRTVLLPAIDAYLAVANTSRGTILNNQTDLCTVPINSLASSSSSSSFSSSVGSVKAHRGLGKSSHLVSPSPLQPSSSSQLLPLPPVVLPIVPDVAVQYRCGDNIGFGKTRYGLLPFRAITSRIPVWARYIYVLADSPLRQRYHAYSSRCSDILLALFKRIHLLFPRAVVVVKRGGDQFLDYARLAYANVTICSASTFCLWPGLANPWGQVHFPLTPLVIGSWNNATARDGVFGPRFHWIKEVDMIKDFKQFRPWHTIMPVLEAY